MGRAVFYFVGGEVGCGDEASAGGFEGGELLGHVAFVEVGGVGGDVFEGGGEFGLVEGVAGLVEVAVALEDAGGGGEGGEFGVLEVVGLLGESM